MMSYWSRPPQPREQLVLFSTYLDEVIPQDHTVRLLDEILSRLDWSRWEAAYHGRLGQPPIHPRVLASVLLYGLLKRIRSSRALEEALDVRMDFRWLAEGRSIDHTTLSEFRRRHTEGLKELFVQIGLVARQLGLLSLEQLAYDGTRLRANNRRHGSRSPSELPKLRQELAAKYAELAERMATADAQEDQTLGQAAPLPAELSDVKRRLAQVDQALAELARVETAEETVPSRIPLTDPQSRVTPNKEGGFAPNYTPLATVDVESGLIVAGDVIAMTDEEHYLMDQLAQVEEAFGKTPDAVLADGKMVTGANLEALAQQEVTLYAPTALPDPEQNPAVREDPTQPVAPDQWDQLPSKKAKTAQGSQWTKEAFVYDAERDCYWCPLGQSLVAEQKTSEPCDTGRLERTRYKAPESACAACVAQGRCLQGQAKRREVSRFRHDGLVEQLGRRMMTPAGQAKYARRREVGERPFAVIKQQFGVRQFLLRGLEKVRQEWRWLTTAFNLQQLFGLIRSRAGPEWRQQLSS